MRFLVLLCISVVLAGCGQLDQLKNLYTSVQGLLTGTDNAEPPQELSEDFVPSVEMTVLWKTSVGKGYNEKVVNLVPSVNEATVYVAAQSGEVEAYNRITGDLEWSVDLGHRISSGPVQAADKLLVGTSNAEVIALSLRDASVQWKTILSSEVLALPRARKNIVAIRTTDGRLFGLDLNTGHIKWSHERTMPALSVRSLGSPSIVEDLVIDGFGGGKLLAVGLQDGKSAWESTTAVPRGRSEVERLVELNAEPLAIGDLLYVTGFQAGVSCVSLNDGDVQWRQPKLFSSHGLVAGRKSLFLSDANSDVWELDLRNGADMWKQAELHQRRLTMPALLGNYLIVGDFEGYLHALSADDGRLLGRFEMDDTPIQAKPVVYSGIIYAYSAGGVLAAIEIH